ncbi:MAG: hypothetical protein ACREV4_05155 [Gammaproteobacteria bacterium]
MGKLGELPNVLTLFLGSQGIKLGGMLGEKALFPSGAIELYYRTRRAANSQRNSGNQP